MLKSIVLAAVLALSMAGSAWAQTTGADPAVPDRPQGAAGQNGQNGQAAPPAQGGIQLPRPDAVPGTTVAVPTSQDDCISAAQALYQAAEGRRLADAQRDRLEELLVRMETHCNARQFQEASAIASDIRIMIEGN